MGWGVSSDYSQAMLNAGVFHDRVHLRCILTRIICQHTCVMCGHIQHLCSDFCNKPKPNPCQKNLHNNTPGSIKKKKTEDRRQSLTTGYRNMFLISFPQQGGREGGGRTAAAQQHRLFGHSLRKIWESPSSSSSSDSFVFLIQATPICFLRMVSGSHRGQHQSSLRHNRGEDCMKNPVI